MTESDAKIIIGSLLHDIGKVIYQDENESKTFGQSGYDYLKNIVGVNDQTILDCVRYSDKKALKSAVSDICDSVYITYMADSIASLKDKDEVDKEVDERFKLHSPLRPVFNILNNNCSDMYYSPSVSNAKQEINYPVNEKRDYSKDDYSKISEVLKNNISHMTYTNDYISLLLDCLENTLSYIPASCDKKEDSDISLYDHLKMSAAYASCISKYVESNGFNLKETLIDKYDDFYKEDAFLLSALDISGIQSFIYTISTKNALKTLRARSFYLEVLMEHVIDEILDRLGLSRTNLIYSGGGHCYILLPNTGDSKLVFDQSVKEVNEWFLKQYGSSLYIAGSYVECSADDLKNNPKGSYSCIYKELSADLATKKLRRYDADQIRYLNNQKRVDYSRECSVCRNTGFVDDEGVCPRCRSLENFSKSVLFAEAFVVMRSDNVDGVELPFGCVMVSADQSDARYYMTQSDYVRCYCKNVLIPDGRNVIKLWIGSYTTSDTFEEMAQKSRGIKRIGVLRADVDNLGQAFVFGFNNENNSDKYVTLSRTAALSRQLSMFFKYHINGILTNPESDISKTCEKTRNATIVYSGGDDLFIVGAWNSIMDLSIDLKNAFNRFTEGTLTISGGIGIYDPNYPISVIADEVAFMEGEAKSIPGKNAITILEDGEKHEITTDKCIRRISDGSYSWDEYCTKVISEKLLQLQEFFDDNPSYGNSFLYRILELIRSQNEKINFARYVYLLSRMEPEDTKDEKGKELKERYTVFRNNMIKWVQNEDDRRHLKTAITMYAYLNRETEVKGE